METWKGNEKGGEEATTQLENKQFSIQVTLVGDGIPLASFSSMSALDFPVLSLVESEKRRDLLMQPGQCALSLSQVREFKAWLLFLIYFSLRRGYQSCLRALSL